MGVEDTAEDVDPWLVSGQAQVALVVGHGYGEALAGASATVGVRLTLHDEGNDDRMVTCASAVLAIGTTSS